jgi:hypothetical protein
VANVQTFLNPYQQESEGIARRKALAQALQQQSLAPSQSNNVAPGGIAYSNPFEPIGRLAQAYFGKKGMERASTDEAALQQKRWGDVQEWMTRNFPGNSKVGAAMEGMQRGVPGAEVLLESSLKAPAEETYGTEIKLDAQGKPYVQGNRGTTKYVDTQPAPDKDKAASMSALGKLYTERNALLEKGDTEGAKVYTAAIQKETGQAEKLSEVGQLMKERTEAQARGDTAAVQQYDSVLAGKVKSGEVDKFKVISGLRDDYQKESKNFQTVHEAYQRLLQSAKNPSGAGDISLIFGYMRMLDPSSTVREGEFATAQNAGTVPQTILSMYNQMLVNGQRLDPAVRQDFVTRAGMLYSPELQTQQQRDAFYAKNAQEFGIDPGLVFRQTKGLSGPKAEQPKTAGPAKPAAAPKADPLGIR